MSTRVFTGITCILAAINSQVLASDPFITLLKLVKKKQQQQCNLTIPRNHRANFPAEVTAVFFFLTVTKQQWRLSENAKSPHKNIFTISVIRHIFIIYGGSAITSPRELPLKMKIRTYKNKHITT